MVKCFTNTAVSIINSPTALFLAVRVEQAEKFNDPKSKYDILVATDAIGMGLNLWVLYVHCNHTYIHYKWLTILTVYSNIRRIIFHTLTKFDGNEKGLLNSSHAKQIAGRAGRYGKDHSHGEVTTWGLTVQLSYTYTLETYTYTCTYMYMPQCSVVSCVIID